MCRCVSLSFQLLGDSKLSKKAGKSNKVRRTREQALSSLGLQIHFMRKSCADFDSGDVNEATRLATAITIVVYDSKYQTSLLTQLDRKNILFFDTATPDMPGNLGPYSGLYVFAMGVGTIDNKPRLDMGPMAPRQIRFEDWWTKPIFDDKKGIVLSRKEVVLFARDTDGGAHVDPELDASYAKLSKEKLFGWVMAVNDEQVKPKTGPDQASLRQIAHEVLMTLKEAFPE